MRIVSIGDPGQEQVAVLRSDREAVLVPTGESGPLGMGAVPDWAERAALALREGAGVSLDGQRLGPPLRPGKIVCVGLNYADHAAEGGQQAPEEPILFLKAPDTVVGPNDDVLLPPGSLKTDWEVELGIVIGQKAAYLPEIAAASACIAGYVLCNDVSERAYQLERGGQWDKGKNCPTFMPLGPWLVTADDVADPQRIALGLEVNGSTLQNSSTAQMIFPVDHLIWYVSQFVTLYPGDLISTGTPAGVGAGQCPPRYLRAGDELRVWADGLGAQHSVIAETPTG